LSDGSVKFDIEMGDNAASYVPDGGGMKLSFRDNQGKPMSAGQVMNVMNEGIATTDSTVTIAVGYDDHISVYELPASSLADLYRMDDGDDINDYIVDNGKHVSDSEEDGEIFFDLTNDDIAEFRHQLKDMVQ